MGGKIGIPEIMLVVVMLCIVAVPIVAVKKKDQKWNYSLGLLFMVFIACADLYKGFDAVLGALIAFLILPVVVAAIYWAISGRKNDLGKLRTSKLFFWFAYVIPLLMRWSESLNQPKV